MTVKRIRAERAPAMTNELLTSAAAERNKDPILTVLESVLPATGSVLEIASGTGQHVCFFAAALPGIRWQPTEPDEAIARSHCRRASAKPASTMSRSRSRSTCTSRAGRCTSSYDAVLCINMIHISPWSRDARAVPRRRAALRTAGQARALRALSGERHGRAVQPGLRRLAQAAQSRVGPARSRRSDARRAPATACSASRSCACRPTT